MIDMDKILETYHEQHNVVYSLVAMVDGEVIARQTSGISADDVTGSAWQIDEAVQKHIVAEIEGAEQNRIDAETEQAIEESRP